MADRDPTTSPRGGANGSLVRRALSAALAVTAMVAALLTSASSAVAFVEVAGSAPEGCPRVVLYFARGSGQLLKDAERGLATPGIQLFDDLARRYEPDVVGSMANAYTAAALTFPVGGLNLPNPFVAIPYRQSVANGVQSADQNIADLATLCPRSWLVLGGYSQGAQVMRAALAKLDEQERQHVAAVVFFGDPYFSASEPNVQTFSTFDRHESGVLRQLPAPVPAPIDAFYGGRVFSWCHLHDIVCQGLHLGNGWSSHKTYYEDAEEAAGRIAGRLAAAGFAPGLPASSATTLYGYRVSGTCAAGTCGLAEWSGPGTSSFRRVGAAYEGQEVGVACQAIGQMMTGASGRPSAIWDQLVSGAFVSDLYLNTPNVGEYSPPLPHCQALAGAAP